MDDYTGPLTLIDVRNTGFIGMDMLNKANVGPINPSQDRPSTLYLQN
jgi:hypothetical protein